MYYSHKTTLFSLCLIASVFAGPSATKKDAQQHPWTTIKNESNFCLFLPPSPGQDVALTEDFGIPFCTSENLVENASLFPEGFIKNAHFAETSDYIQVTGYFDRSKYSLNETDGGGQYDNHAKGKPVGAQCKGYNYFVNLIEPDVERYCIRCCQDKKDCNTGRSGFGCLRVIDGDYTLPEETIESIKESIDEAIDESIDESIDGSINESIIENISENISESLASAFEDLASVTFDNEDVDTHDELVTQPTTGVLTGKMILDDIESLKNDLFVGGHKFTLEQVTEKWNSLINYLTENYPAATYQIEQLKTVADALTSLEQWKAYFFLTADKIHQLQFGQDVLDF